MTAFSFILALLAAQPAPASSPASQATAYDREIRPMVKQYCLTCHSASSHAGDLNLERFTTYQEVLKDPRPWQKLVEQISLGEMPPKGMPQPASAQRARLLAWTHGALQTAARAHAGDPGPVVLRRLNNAEYTFTVRDLTGVASLDPAREFPADGAAGEGFMNTGNALAISPSLVAKYLDAGKNIAGHAVLLPDGIRFSPAASRRDWTDEILGNIRAFYGKFTESAAADTVTQQGIALDKNRGGVLPIRRYLTASLSLRGAATPVSVARVARQQGLSAKYLGALVTLLKDTRPSPLLDGLRARWRTAQPADVDGMLIDIGRWQETLWKFSSVGHIGKVNGPKGWMEPVTPMAGQQEFRVNLEPPESGNAVSVYLTAHDAGDGSAGDFVVWQQPQLAIPGRKPVLLRDLPAFIDELTARRTRVFAATSESLMAAAEGRTEISGAGADERKAWFDFLGVNHSGEFKLDLLTQTIQKSGEYDFVKGWGTSKTPMLLANSSAQQVRVPGMMKAHGVAVHPSQTLQAAIGWNSPVSATLRIEGSLTRAHVECGNGVTWSLELRRASTRQLLANGEARNAAPVQLGPIERVRVQPGDLISILVGPREGNHSCDLTDVDLRLATVGGEARQWSLAGDVSGNVLAGNPNGPWRFYTEPVTAEGNNTVLPAGSLLARWQAAESMSERRQLADALQRLLTDTAPPATDKGPDATLYRQLSSLAGPLFAGVTAPAATAVRSSAWGLDPGRFGKRPDGTSIDAASLYVRAPSMIEVRLPADLVANSQFVTTGALDAVTGKEGSVQLEVLTTKPERRSGLLPAGTTVGTGKGLWSANNQVVSYAMPVVTREGSAARKRVEAAFDEFRQMFPASLCYTKIVPVDEVVTLTLFYREDHHLSRLILDGKQKAELDRLWDELHYVSRDALTSVDVFEQLWQYATQDADPSSFEPLRKPINDRAAAFRQRLVDTEPRHVDAVVRFANRAYRRPLTAPEEAQLRGLYQKLRAQELPHEDSVRLLLARVLVSPGFLYRGETAGPGKQAKPVNDFELASRLSYFLWSSQPDAELRAAAAAGKLRTAAGLRAQTRRMLGDPRVRRLGTEFGAAWLHIHGFDSLDEKSERHFPEFLKLRDAMYEESIQYFTDFFSHDRSVLSLLDSDHTFLNESLAQFYGIPGVTGSAWRRVEGVKKFARGGILGQAAVLAKQSGASRTSPILRGNWISEVLLGDKLPRPPKDVPQLPTDEAAESLSVRELTQKHTSDPRCSGCHARIDPYGYTLERFDAVGRWRDKDLGGRPINDHSKLKDGYELAGVDGLRNYLLTKGRPAFVRQFCKKLLGYSLGRAVLLSDEPLLDAMQSQLAASDYHVGTAIDLIVASRQFREIRGRDYEQEHE